MSTLHEDVSKLEAEAKAKLDEAAKLKELVSKYPGLKKRVGRWNKVAYYTRDVNESVTRFDMRHNCGCCNDSPLEIWPYLETPIGNVYSDPPCFQVGERHWMGGDRPYDGWQKSMRAAGIPESIIDAVSTHFIKDREDRIASAAEDGDTDEAEAQ